MVQPSDLQGKNNRNKKEAGGEPAYRNGSQNNNGIVVCEEKIF